jgi:hypothetical protein
MRLPAIFQIFWACKAVLRDLKSLVPLSSLHQPPSLAVVRVCSKHFPSVPQPALFGTAFHSALPPTAYTYAIPQLGATPVCAAMDFTALPAPTLRRNWVRNCALGTPF